MTIDMSYYRTINGLINATDKKDYLQKQAIKSVNKTNDSTLSTFEILINSNYAEDIIADGINTKGIFDYSKNAQDVKTKTELASYMKELWIEVGSSNVGSVVKHTDKISLIENTYIVVSKQEDMDGYDVCYTQRCNNILQFYSSTSTLHSIPCIISKGSISLDEQKIISTLDSEIAVQISNTSITRQIGMNNVFKIGIRSWKVTNIDDITVNGLLLIKMQYSEVEQIFPSYSLTILNGDSIQADINTPVQLSIQVKDRETIITSPLLTFTSSNNLIATVSSTGLVSFLSVGNIMISCKLQSDNLIQDSIGIEVVEEEQHNYTAEIDLGSISIIKTYSSTYTCTFKDNGIAITDSSVFYLTADDGVSATSLASIVSQDSVGNSCVVKGLNLGYVKLFVKNVGETVFSSGFRIQIKSIF